MQKLTHPYSLLSLPPFKIFFNIKSFVFLYSGGIPLHILLEEWKVPSYHKFW